jgi:hypothetical protein
VTPRKLKRLADISTVSSAIITAIGVVIAAATIVVSSCQFQKGQESEHESKAVELFIKYGDVMKELAASTKGAAVPENLWRENLAIGIAESIFRLEKGDRGWENTVRGMVLTHADFLRDQGLNCETFDSDFITLVNQQVRQNVCNEKRDR